MPQHRDEQRGVGGVFFDDFAELGLERSFGLMQAVGDAFLGAYLPTHFGLQSGGRTESILLSMPPLAAWAYRHEAAEGTPEAELTRRFLVRRDWL